jgi:4-hydroxy-3-polyprenylbenzoate decarboxylase
MSSVQYEDLREFIDRVREIGALRTIEGADPDREIGAVTEVAAGLPACPALLFEAIPGYPRGHRIFTNATVSPQRAALALGIDPALPPLEALKEWRRRRERLVMHAPRTVKAGPVLENSQPASAIDVRKFPAPVWHADDGGAYIGSGSIVVMRDPDSGWINASIYRVQVHGADRLTVQFDHAGRHGAIIARKYWQQGKPCPVAVVNGPDPSVFIAGFEYLPEGASEYDFAGAIRGRPLEVVAAPHTGLPVPARAEFVFEGSLPPQATLPEGPFGEFTGYYAAEKRPAPLMQVAAVHSRTDPILLGSPPMKPPRFHFGLPFRAASIWSNLEAIGVTDIVGAWQHVAQLMTVIALRQRYAGHSKRAGLVAAAQSYMGRIVVTVDEDVDPSNLADVMWAVATRCEPSEQVDIVRNAWSSALDPRVTPQDRERGQTSNSKMIIDACKPFGWREAFPRISALSQEHARVVAEKWLKSLLP